MTNCNRELNVSGMHCPFPILKTKKEIEKLESGQVLKIIATDRELVNNSKIFCRQTRNKLLKSDDNDGTYVVYIQKT